MAQEKLDKISGVLLGCAVGDALGAPVEFMRLREIKRKFGEEGIQNYSPAYGKIGAITDDTQMTLFTLEGLLNWKSSGEKGESKKPEEFIRDSYIRWLGTQGIRGTFRDSERLYSGKLFSSSDMNHQRAPGMTCIDALSKHLRRMERNIFDLPDTPLNDSKGCGGIMRTAPAGFFDELDPFDLGCKAAAITHSHPTGYLAAGFFSLLINLLLKDASLKEAVQKTIERLKQYPDREETLEAVEKALVLADRGEPSFEKIESLGGGWIAEEALSISLYCSLKAESFIHGVRLAVNISGDSDSTGSITGSILGAIYGLEGIPVEFLKGLELRKLMEDMAAEV